MRHVRTAASLIFVTVLLSDRITKILAQRLSPGESFALGNVFALTTHHNFGIIANVPVPRWAIIFVTLCVIGGLLVVLRRCVRAAQYRSAYALTCILAGAIGNLWDRWSTGYVMDWILLFHTSVINIADIAIAFGILWFLVESRRMRVS